MRKHFKPLFLAAALALPACSLLAAPNPPTPPERGPGMGMRDNPKFKLPRLIRGVGRLEEDKKTALSKDQAKRFVGVVKPWTAKPKMTDNEARAVYTKASGVLTAAQKKALETMPMRGPGGDGRGDGRGPGGPGGGDRRGGPGGGGPGGGPGAEGRRRGGDGAPGGGAPTQADREKWEKERDKFRKAMENYNPLYPPSKSPVFKDIPERMQDRMTRRYDETVDVINKLAKKAK